MRGNRALGEALHGHGLQPGVAEDVRSGDDGEAGPQRLVDVSSSEDARKLHPDRGGAVEACGR